MRVYVKLLKILADESRLRILQVREISSYMQIHIQLGIAG